MQAKRSPPQHCKAENEQDAHHSKTAKLKTSKTFTTATLQITEQARHTQQQSCKYENERDVHYSNITLQIKSLTRRALKKHCKSENEQDVYHSNIANRKTSRTCTTATLQIKRMQGCTSPTRITWKALGSILGPHAGHLGAIWGCCGGLPWHHRSFNMLIKLV